MRQDSRLRWFRREWKAKLHLCCSQTASENALRPAQPLKRLRSLELLHVPVGLHSFPSPYSREGRNSDSLIDYCDIAQPLRNITTNRRDNIPTSIEKFVISLTYNT